MTLSELLGLKKKDFIFTGRNNSKKIEIPYSELNERAKDLIEAYKITNHEESKSKIRNELGKSIFNQFGNDYKSIGIRSPDGFYMELEQTGEIKSRKLLIN